MSSEAVRKNCQMIWGETEEKWRDSNNEWQGSVNDLALLLGARGVGVVQVDSSRPQDPLWVEGYTVDRMRGPGKHRNQAALAIGEKRETYKALFKKSDWLSARQLIYNTLLDAETLAKCCGSGRWRPSPRQGM